MAESGEKVPVPGAFSVIAKPAGPGCNLRCAYCFYRDKESLYPDKSLYRMEDGLLEEFIRQYIESQPTPVVNFAWQGGEPTLLGLDFFRKVVDLQAKFRPPGKSVTNALQTNGILLDEEWCEFLSANGFLVGLSVDGPRELHDRYRLDLGGGPTFDRVLSAMRLMKRNRVEFNTLTVVNNVNAAHPENVYRFLRDEGSAFMQFIPIVERVSPSGDQVPPPVLTGEWEGHPISPWSVDPEEFGRFLCGVFDEWVRRDVGRIFIQQFEVQVGLWCGLPSSLCAFSPVCGDAVVVEHNGDIYSCDHFVYPQCLLGNLRDVTLAAAVFGARQRKFGAAKRDFLPRACSACEFLFACRGECPKNRISLSPDGQPGMNYLCPGYKMFFGHIARPMRLLRQVLERGLPASAIMRMV